MRKEKIFSKSVLSKPETKRASRVVQTVDLTKLARMGWNENPYGMSPKALESYIEAASSSHYYQDFWCRDLKREIADFYDLKPANVLTGAGSSPLIDIIGQAFLDPCDEVLMCPTFAAFVDMADMHLAKTVMVPLLEDMTFDLDGLADAITDKTKMIVICNPNNPTGTYVGYEKIKAFIEKVPEDVVLVFDEAYIEFAHAKDCKSVYPLIKEYPNKSIVVIKTFSKYYGMAGIRSGYILANKELIDGISVVPESYMSRAAQAASIAALHDQDFYQASKEKILEGKAYLENELKRLGCTVYPSQTNFIMFNPHCDCEEIREEMINRGILISTPMLCRVSVCDMEQNKIFINYMKKLLEIPA